MNEESKNQKQTRRKFSDEFKDQILARAEMDGVAQVAKDLGIKETMIYSWRAKKKSGGVAMRTPRKNGI